MCHPKDTEQIQTACEWLLLALVLYSLYIDFLSREEMVKSCILFISLYVSISESISIAALCWISTCVIATSQLLRWPSSLKVYLRKVRTILGPSYAILIMGACYKEHHSLLFNNNYTDAFGADDTNTKYYGHHYPLMIFILVPSLLKVAFISSFIASVFYRPDNNSIWMVFVTQLSKQKKDLERKTQAKIIATNTTSPHHDIMKRHRSIHAMMMMLSYFCMIIKFFHTEYNYNVHCVGILLIVSSLIGFIIGNTAFHLFDIINKACCFIKKCFPFKLR